MAGREGGTGREDDSSLSMLGYFVLFSCSFMGIIVSALS
jgi:hypothetical protein